MQMLCRTRAMRGNAMYCRTSWHSFSHKACFSFEAAALTMCGTWMGRDLCVAIRPSSKQLACVGYRFFMAPSKNSPNHTREWPCSTLSVSVRCSRPSNTGGSVSCR